MTIQILGGGCAKCKKLEESAAAAVAELGIDAEIVKVTDMDEIMDMGVMVTPALAVDGDVKTTGKVLTPAEVKEYL
ncbi:MAG: thioredoxin family protein [Spirochaetales bacterium]|uniref:Thioredoxin family protein n=1 Tax=Candidatus Thalassospirochaeta sargassi TaxID=3119039 RepID=A0AAJ1IDZ2_9SPIO|nr:thioredoxin family protein [Spirochaetales bacterium]